MTPRGYALLALLATVLAVASASAQDAPQKPRCTFQTLPDGPPMNGGPRALPGPGKGRV